MHNERSVQLLYLQHTGDMSLNSTSSYLLDYFCSYNSPKFIPFYTVRIILLLTVSVLVFYVGHQRWRRQHTFKTASHSDIFTYHVAAMELIWVLGCFLIYYGTYTNHLVSETVGSHASRITYYGEIFFHLLTCVERYLAVVHPITYMSLRNARGVRIRNICIGCVWVLSLGMTCVKVLLPPNYKTVILFCILAPSIIIISFCSLSVLCVLIRPGPGEAGGKREMVDQSKLRAFYTITAITCAVWLWVVGFLVSSVLKESLLLSSTGKCSMLVYMVWFNLPSCLVLPLLYLHRAGKLSCCCYTNK
ncbi:hypothetical protein ACER0C_001777 [Sarotherodon galilaeus]